MKVNRILVPLDFSRPSLEALESGLELAEAFGASVEVLHVVDTMRFAPLVGPPTTLDAVRRSEVAAAHRRLEKVRRKVGPRRFEVRFTLKVGAPHLHILDVARRSGADMIVMATHGRTGLPRLFLGSVAEKVLRSATCPVLTIRPQPKVRRRRRA